MTVHPKFDPSARVLLGPGPSMTHPRVMRALSAPTIGHLDPEFLALYAEEQDLLRAVFQTKNEWTFALSGTGTSGMESALVNLIEPGDEVLVAIHGYFGERLAEIAARVGGQVDRITRPLGEIFTLEEIESALKQKPYKLFAIVHAETSTGAEQLHIQDIADLVHRSGALLLLGPTFLKTRFGVDEVVTTLLLNFVMVLFVSMLLDGALKDPMGLGWPQSKKVLAEAQLPKLIQGKRLHLEIGRAHV